MASLSDRRVRPVNSPLHPHWLAIVLSSPMAFAPLAIDMYLPALPGIGRDLAASPALVQLSLSSFFLGFGSGQLIWGRWATGRGGGGRSSPASCSMSPAVWPAP